MSFLLRLALPNVPGSLGRLATAIGAAGGDIDAIQIVETHADGTAVDDVLLNLAPGTMPDSVVSACNALDGVEVLWISRYAVGGNLSLDLEALETITANAAQAVSHLVAVLPLTFRADWAAVLGRTGTEVTVVERTEAAPEELPWPDEGESEVLLDDDQMLTVCVPLGADRTVLLGRRGGPAFLESEVARLRHLAALTVSIEGAAGRGRT